MFTNNLQFNAASPIGIFDSGVGGLTVAKALIEQLPKESIVYYGDTAHFPYGEQSANAIQKFSLKIVDFLLEKNCKLILIACSSASAAAYDTLKQYIGDRALLVNVIDPFITYLQNNYSSKRVGLIGTKQTVGSKTYQRKVAENSIDIELRVLATPLLAPAIEEGFIDHEIADAILREYLAKDVLQDIEALILACTHYPLIKHKIINYYRGQIEVIDPAPIVAAQVRRLLEENNLLNKNSPSSKLFYVSYFTENFAARSRVFFGDDIDLLLVSDL